jgi:hypothetical protein
MLYNVPIEPFEERYTSQWGKWFSREFERQSIETTTITSVPLTYNRTSGSFLDVASTNHFKAVQLANICQLFFMGKIKPRDIFFFHDLWFPGIEMLAYMRDGLDIPIKIYGILHAGCYDNQDFLYRKGMSTWGNSFEACMAKIVQKIFVGSKFHKDLVFSNLPKKREDIVVTGLPIYPEFVEDNPKKENIIVFPHRLDKEKQPGRFYELAMQNPIPGWNYIFSKEACKTKKEYYDLLNKSRIAVSFALQETWGIAMQEATMCGCIPLVPNRLSYSVMYPNSFQYKTIEELEKVIKNITTESQYPIYKENAEKLAGTFEVKGDMAIFDMLVEMGYVPKPKER